MDLNGASQVALGGVTLAGDAWAQVLHVPHWKPVTPPVTIRAGGVARDVQLADGGSFVIAGADSDAAPWVMRYDAAGKPAWPSAKTAPAPSTAYLSSISLQTNGHVLAAGDQPRDLCE